LVGWQTDAVETERELVKADTKTVNKECRWDKRLGDRNRNRMSVGVQQHWERRTDSEEQKTEREVEVVQTAVGRDEQEMLSERFNGRLAA